MLQNLCDTHTHTLFSLHAYSTVEEDVRAASEAGLELLGIADHFSAMVSATGDVREYQHFLNMTCWPRRWHGVTLLRAAEVDILDVDGTLFGQDRPIAAGITGMPLKPQSLFDHCTRACDYLIASVHHEPLFCDLPAAQAMGLYLKALSHPKVLMAGHMGRAAVGFETAPVLEFCRTQGKLVEINEHSLDFANGGAPARCRDLAVACAEAGVMVAVNTDAHISCDVGRAPRALAMLEEIHFPPELVATRSADSFLGAVARAVGPVPGL
ncbi:PHP domain-containing protein [Atopobiaceae bacterium 24-176]